MKKSTKAIAIGIIVTVAAVFIAVATLSTGINHKNKSTATSPSQGATPTASATNRTITYNDLDEAAIVGALSLVRQTPTSSNKTLSIFLASLAKAKTTPNKSNLDMAVQGNILSDYIVSKNGSDGAICFAVRPPFVKNGTPGQVQWVAYYERNTKKGDLLLVVPGILSCTQAISVAKVVPLVNRTKYSTDSLNTVKSAILKLPASVLTPIGLQLLDEARGLSNANATTPPGPAPTTSKK